MVYVFAQRLVLVLSLFVMAGSLALGFRTNNSSSTISLPGVNQIDTAAVAPVVKFPCLPKDVGPNDVVSYGLKGTRPLTVQKQLVQLKAVCRRGKLVDAKGREIRFFRPSCWGNPPADYLEIQERERKELADLKKRYTVIVFSCNPMIQ